MDCSICLDSENFKAEFIKRQTRSIIHVNSPTKAYSYSFTNLHRITTMWVCPQCTCKRLTQCLKIIAKNKISTKL